MQGNRKVIAPINRRPRYVIGAGKATHRSIRQTGGRVPAASMREIPVRKRKGISRYAEARRGTNYDVARLRRKVRK